MSRCKLRTPWPIHFKLRIVIGIDSLMVCIKLEISSKSIQTVRLSIPITAKFEVNWPRGSQFTL
jgi:hypothetical protein